MLVPRPAVGPATAGRAVLADVVADGAPVAPPVTGAAPEGGIDRVVVVVPAHDEEETLPACLAALRTAAAAVGVPVEVVVVLDACTDASATLLGTGVRPVVVDHRCVGAARAAGFAAAGVGPRTWCASTDADSAVGPAWLVAQLSAAARGADVVAGTVRATSWAGHAAVVRDRFEASYVGADDHRHVHGASLGVRGATYLALGGFAALTAHEDVDLVDRALRAGATVRWAGPGDGMVVDTSTRTRGRAADGFAAHLRALAAGTRAPRPAGSRQRTPVAGTRAPGAAGTARQTLTASA